jgi:hypothetical protein
VRRGSPRVKHQANRLAVRLPPAPVPSKDRGGHAPARREAGTTRQLTRLPVRPAGSRLMTRAGVSNDAAVASASRPQQEPTESRRECRVHAKGAAACPASIAVGTRSMHRQCIGCREARNASVSRRDVSSGHRRGLQGPPCWASRPPRSRRCPGIRIMKRTAGCSWGWSGFYSHVERGRAKLTRYGPSPATTIPDS